MASIGENDYRAGARERLADSFTLLREGQFAGSIYLGGLAVEGVLRAVIWKCVQEYARGKKSLATGHNLQQMLKLVRSLVTLHDQRLAEAIAPDIQKVARLWWNNMRFLPEAKIENIWYDMGEVRPNRKLKLAAKDFHEACARVLKQCEDLWHK